MKLPAAIVALLSAHVLAAPPNVVMIVSDDQGYGDCSAYPAHAPDVQTPNIDRIAHGGVVFTNGYVSAPVCSPSRTGLITGRYQERFDKDCSWHTTLPESAATIAEHLHAAGYATCMIGKNDFGMYISSRSDRRYPMNHGYDHTLSFEGHAHDYFALTRADELSAVIPHSDAPNIGPLDFDYTTKDFHGYTTDIFTDEAIGFIKSHRDQPFYIDLAYNAVHDLVEQVPQKYLDKFGVRPIPPYDPRKYPSYRDYYRIYNYSGTINEEQMRRFYLADLNCLDDNIGRLLDTLHDLRLTDNTLIVFISDNGGASAAGGNNQPLRGAKNSLYEGGIREPFLVQWPGPIAPRQTIDTPVISLDLLPTFVQAAGGKPISHEASIDGVSLLPLLAGHKPLPTRPLFWQFRDQYAVRLGDWKLVKTHLIKLPRGHDSWILTGPQSESPQLFNLKADLQEQRDLSKEDPEIVQHLNLLYQNWSKTRGELSIAPAN